MVNIKNKIGFTLAEVLIVLGIIGVVASVTMPNWVAKYKSRILEARFRQTYSVISQAAYSLKAEFGISSLYDYYTSMGYVGKTSTEFTNDFRRHLKNPHVVPTFNPEYKTYDGTQIYRNSSNSYSVARNFNTILSNGAYLATGIGMDSSGKLSLLFQVDINGKQGPNRVGYDLFYFRILDSSDKIFGYKMTQLYTEDDKDKYENNRLGGMLGNPCSRYSRQVTNGIGCTGFAIENICPDDDTKTYWECLYKK